MGTPEPAGSLGFRILSVLLDRAESAWHEIPNCALGRAGPLCPGRSDIDFLGDLEGVVDFDAKITHRAFDLGMAEQSCRAGFRYGDGLTSLGSAQRMRSELARIKAYAADPLGHEARVLPRGQGRVSASWKQVLAWLASSHAKIVVERLPCRLGQLKANGPAGLSLSDICSVMA